MKDANGKLKQPVQIALVVAGVLLLALVGYFALVRPQKAQVKSLLKEQQAIQQDISDRRRETASARSRPKIRFADVYRLAKAMPNKTDMPDLLLELTQLARDTGIRFDSIQPGEAVSHGTYESIPITVTFNGNFFNLADFLYRMRALVDVRAGRLDATGRLFAAESIAFTESPLKFPKVQASLIIDAFVYGTSLPTANGTVPPPTDTTASTTSTATTTTSAPSASASAAEETP